MTTLDDAISALTTAVSTLNTTASSAQNVAVATATEKASLAITQASIATTKAGEANASAIAAAASAAALNSGTIDINGGTVDGAVIGGAVPAAGSFTTLSAQNGLALTNGNTINWGGPGSSMYVDGSAATNSWEVVTGNEQRVLVNDTGLAVTGGISATNNISTVGSSNPNLALQLSNTGASGRDWQIISSSVGGMDGGGTLNIRDNTSGANRVTLDASGNLGLGVVPSGWASVIKPLELNNGVYFASQTDGEPVLYAGVNNYYASGAFKYKLSSKQASRYQQDQGTHSWHTAPSGTAGAQISFTQALTLDALGNLLVGMTSAAASSAKTIHMANATAPTANPSGGGILWVEGGALKFRGSSGTVTTLAVA